MAAKSKGLAPVWERDLSLDTEASWAAFKHFRDTQRPRPELKALGEALGYPAQLIYDWSSRCLWRERIVEFDRHLDRIAVRAAETEVQRTARRHLKLARSMQELGGTAIAKAKALEKSYQAAPYLNPREAVRAVVEGVKIDRLVNGLVTERTGDEFDYSQLSPEEFEALGALLDKCRKN